MVVEYYFQTQILVFIDIIKVIISVNVQLFNILVEYLRFTT